MRAELLLGLGLAAILGIIPASADAQTEDVVWTSAVGVSVSGNNLTKTASAGWGNSGAVSSVVMDWGPAYLEFTASETSTSRMVGLGSGDTNQSYTDIDYAVYLAGSTVYVYESGISRGSFGAYATGDIFRVEAELGVVRYRKNGVVFYTSSVPPQFPLLVDAALYTNGATINGVVVGTSGFSRAANIAVRAGTLTKTGSAGWNAGAVSANALELGDGFVSFVATETDRDRACGLGFGDTDVSLADIEYAILLGSDGTFSVTESGTSRGNFGPYVSGDVFRVEVQEGTVSYEHNDTTVYVSSLAPEYPLRVDTALEDVGASLTDVRFVTLLWTNTVGVTATGTSLTKAGSAGWNAGASSTTAIPSGDGWMEFTASETTTDRIAGFGSADANQELSDVDFGIWLKSDGTFSVAEDGTDQGSLGSYAKGDRFRVEVAGGGVKYRKNGTVFFSSSGLPTYPLTVDTSLNQAGATIKNVSIGGLVWKDDAGLVVRGSSLQKTAAAGWGNSGASTTSSLVSGDGWVEVVAGEASNRMFGLSNGDQNTNYSDIDFAFYPQTGFLLGIYENGTSRGSFGSYAAGDRLTVDVTSNVVRYYRNETLLYTSTRTPTYPLLVDTAFLTANATLSGFSFRGGSASLVDTPSFSPNPGTYSAGQDVTIDCFTFGAEVRYTTDGTDPTPASTLYTGPISLSAPTTISARAWKTGMATSPVATGAYAFQVADPSATPGAGTYDAAQEVGVSTSTSGATIHYTTNGTTPSETSPILPPSGAVTVDHSLTLRAKGWRTGWSPSGVSSASYTLKPASPGFAPMDGFFTNSAKVVLRSTTPSVTIHYTTDGTTPTLASPSVASGGTVVMTQTTTVLKALAVRAGWTASAVTAGGPYLVTIDTDNDGLEDSKELEYGTDPANPDTNGDGVFDGSAVLAGISPTNLDMDDDGVQNQAERSQGSDPFRSDTDGDGVNDAADCFPLDSIRSQCPAPIPGDIMPPAITLTEPTGAVLISSLP